MQKGCVRKRGSKRLKGIKHIVQKSGIASSIGRVPSALCAICSGNSTAQAFLSSYMLFLLRVDPVWNLESEAILLNFEKIVLHGHFLSIPPGTWEVRILSLTGTNWWDQD